jgi:hypothetical protein
LSATILRALLERDKNNYLPPSISTDSCVYAPTNYNTPLTYIFIKYKILHQRESCLMVLDSVTSTPQWICHERDDVVYWYLIQ